MTRAISRSNRAAGFSLVEILVALVILSVGLLGLAGLQTSSLRAGDDAYLRSEASILAYNLIDRMRANPAAAKAQDYDIDFGDSVDDPPDCTASTCGSGDLAKWGLDQWLGHIDKLPDSKAKVSTKVVDKHTRVQVQIDWLEKQSETTNTEARNAANTGHTTSLTVVSVI
jgi:type IV pilus assembly protein PilV